MRTAEAGEIAALEVALAAERERNRRLEAQLRNLADHDPLTDLLNRRTMELALERHLARCVRYGAEGALLLVALDGLGSVATAQGQAAADEVLAAVGERMAARLRTTDVAGRWGDDELAVLLPRATLDGVDAVAGALVEIVTTTGTPQVAPGSVTAAIGVALVDAPVVGTALAERAAVAALDARRLGGGWSVAAI